MSQIRTIKKYPNRRLYDTHESRYVTLRDLRRLVLEGIPFEVIDRHNGTAITEGILLQVLTESESDSAPVLSAPVLRRLIRLQSENRQSECSHLLEQALAGLPVRETSGTPGQPAPAPRHEAPDRD